MSSKELDKSERPLSVKLSVKWRVQAQLARTRQNCTETRPLLANASEPDRFTIHATLNISENESCRLSCRHSGRNLDLYSRRLTGLGYE